jgi:hypothetical protein
VGSSGRIRGEDVEAAKLRLKVQPMTVAVSAGNDTWRFYKSGIMTKQTSNCGNGLIDLDHGVTLVGYSIATDCDKRTEPRWEYVCRAQNRQDRCCCSGCDNEAEELNGR